MKFRTWLEEQEDYNEDFAGMGQRAQSGSKAAMQFLWQNLDNILENGIEYIQDSNLAPGVMQSIMKAIGPFYQYLKMAAPAYAAKFQAATQKPMQQGLAPQHPTGLNPTRTAAVGV